MNNYDYYGYDRNNDLSDNWTFNMNSNFNPTYDVMKVNHKLYNPYEGYIRGNLYQKLYMPYKIKRPIEIKPANEQADLLIYIDALNFAALDLNLYLDIFPKDEEMIKKFNEYRKEANKAVGEYEKKYGPLFVNSSASNDFPWRWNESPWPWDKEE